VAREHGNRPRRGERNAQAVMRLRERGDALRRPQRFEAALLACECDARGRAGLDDAPYPQRARLSQALQAVLAADVHAVAQAATAQGLQGPAIGARIREVRVAALAQALAG
ncbi:MAG: multifunctional CCA tRNA nucleotidyl transferase/2'3'-cyclic phosphodiesterase/2'nucleotidase/phosphatase, partial [Burkholderiales bacterium PBB4]